MLLTLNPNSIFFNELNDVFEGFNRKNHPVNPFKNFGNTAVNVLENEQKFTIELTAPGFEKDNFNVSVEGKTLVIKGNKEEEKTTEGQYKRKEFHAQSFQRSFTLPENIDENQIDAQYKNGILYVELPKKEVVKVKEIQVKIA